MSSLFVDYLRHLSYLIEHVLEVILLI